MENQTANCPCCHCDSVEILQNSTYGFITVCQECGFAWRGLPTHLLAG